MTDAAVSQVRSFNRLVTERVGALDDHYLARDRPLGQARLLWEVGLEGCEVRQLRARLRLDSGYLSRLLRSLEADGLVAVGPAADDRRVRRVRLTSAGLAERDLLDRRSNQLARSLLQPLSEPRRERLIAAMAEVERLLTASLIEFAAVDPAHPDAQLCLREYFAEIDRRFDAGFDAALSTAPSVDDFREPLGGFLLARLHGEPVGCGALRFHGDGPADLKRMWVAGHARGVGIGRLLLEELERHAAVHGAGAVRLETNRDLPEAIALYRSAGYREVAPFNDEAYAHHWFEKQLGEESSSALGAARGAGAAKANPPKRKTDGP
jgi:DNA-binding MarR family transcriptional regulator/GNAT superfamily N-acetyltransferase